MRAKIIAEISSNHNGDFGRCLAMIIAAKHCGCWAAKFQYYKDYDLPDYNAKVNFLVPFWWLPEMFLLAKRLDIILFPSIFHHRAYEELSPYTKIFKIASPESTDLGMLRYENLNLLAPRDSRLFVSAGPSHFWRMRSLFPRRQMFYCKAGYPATVDEQDIKFMAENAIGFSDHTEGIVSTMAMIGAGAQYIEKHFKLDDDCPDAHFSLNPDQMKMLCDLAK